MAGIGIDEFKANFQGGARPSLFRVEQQVPGGVGGDGAQKMTYMCKGAQLPGSTVNAIDVPYMGRQLKVPGDRIFEEITLTIINDVDFAVRKMYERWMALMNTHEGNIGLINPNQLWADLTITQLGRDGNPQQAYKIVSGFPTNVAPIELSFDSTDQIEEFTVTIAYQYWQTEEVK
jgi:hypothetical protein